jgi:hypothetical protein
VAAKLGDARIVRQDRVAEREDLARDGLADHLGAGKRAPDDPTFRDRSGARIDDHVRWNAVEETVSEADREPIRCTTAPQDQIEVRAALVDVA